MPEHEPELNWPELLGSALDSAYFVGGCVRDALLGRPLRDIDILVGGEARSVAERIAGRLRAPVFPLKEELGVYRLPRRSGLLPQIDVVELEAGSLEDDLLKRDLTINAMALPCCAGFRGGGSLVDPTGGEADLGGRRLRFVSDSAPEKDPLRVLRLFRFKSTLGFTPIEDSLALAVLHAPGLARVAGERIRDELFWLMEGGDAVTAIAGLTAAGAGPWTLGAGGDAGTVERQLIRCRALQSSLPEEIRLFLHERYSTGLSAGLILDWLACCVAAGGESEVHRLASRFGLAAAEASQAVRSLQARSSAASLLDASRPKRSDWLLYRQSARSGAVLGLLLAALQSERRPPEEPLLELVEWEREPPRPLLDGQRVMQICGIKAGRRVGELLQELLILEADGVVTNPDEAEAWLRRREPAVGPPDGG